MLISFFSFLLFYLFTFKSKKALFTFLLFYPFTFKSPLKVFSDAILLTFWATSKKV
nr:MAG TPA: hypothetical protein [Caudoviricetes sp.]